MEKQTKKPIKYFEFTVGDARNWDWKDYILFLIESLYQTIFPFCAGMLLVYRGEIVWLFMLILPVYFRLQIQKKESGKLTKKIYIKD